MPIFDYKLVRPLLHRLDPERAHGLAITALKWGLAGRDRMPDDPILGCRLWGLDFPNPIGLAAGFDKGAEVPDALLSVGFGFIEAGTVTPRAQPGNPKPRLFRLKADQAAINRLGFNSDGLEPYAKRLLQRWGKGGIVGANVGKNKETEDAAADFATGTARVAGSCDYIVTNISSPNTEGLRALQGRRQLEKLLERVLGARNRVMPGNPPPLLVKVAPDLTPAEMQDIVEVVLAAPVEGLIIGNTTLDRPASLKSPDRGEEGGLSGLPLMKKSTECLAEFYRLTEGRLPLIGCGGVASGRDAYAKIRAGASLVQLYTALIYHGPGLVRDIKRELAECLRADGFEDIASAVGADHR